ncbi:hypothetical protein HPP92_028297 [Vanilla planifolia]|uniref:Secreted protein n=1 Tax=Vanilla planifolia TaxID=51239 RepID=A0A835P8C7_VANPL|nr:hypothetical protein HPP92_028297 [Vanilla planifolia]
MASWNAVWRLMSLFLPQEQSGCILTTGSLFIVHVGECIEEIADRKELLHSGACPYSPLGTWWRDREGNQRQQNGGHDQRSLTITFKRILGIISRDVRSPGRPQICPFQAYKRLCNKRIT